MKRKERHHLKENELVHSINAARDFLEPRKQQLTGLLIGALVLLLVVVGVVVFRNRSQSQGQDLLAEAMVALNARVVPVGATGEDNVPAAASLGATGTFATEDAKLNAALPKLEAAAEAYPDSEAGVTARYHLAGALAALGRHKEAIQAFDEVVQRAGDESLYGRMALLGKADAQSEAGELDAAIATWKDLASSASEELPVDAILMQLARAYTVQGNTEEARKAYTQIVDEHPESPYTPEAREELESLKG
jgi:tetratricopeptide (TPR) repeat protein